MTARNSLYFNSSPEPTIGVEIELQILNKNTLDLEQSAPVLLEHFENDIQVKEELLNSIIEINTGICNNVGEVREDLKNKISDVIKVADSNNLLLLSTGTHPFANYHDQTITNKDRYINFVDRMQWPLRRMLITGLHVHIGIESGEKAIAINNGLIRYIPIMIALSANSPYFEGELSGLVSTRSKIFEGLPSTGIPPVLKNYSEFQKFMRTLQKANTIESIREVWWDIRPHPGYGTVEVRSCDSVTTLDQMVELAALTQCLVVGLSDHYDDGTQLPMLDSWIVNENKWRAIRYGLDADLIIDDTGNQQSIKGVAIDTIERLLHRSKDLGCENELHSIVNRIENNSSPYIQQIGKYNETGSFKAMIMSMVNDFYSSVS